MKPQTKLSTTMTQAQFDDGYWYAAELKEFAKTIGIPSSLTWPADAASGEHLSKAAAVRKAPAFLPTALHSVPRQSKKVRGQGRTP